MFHVSLSVVYSSIDKDITVSINSVILYFVTSGMGKIKRLTLLSKYEDGSLKLSFQVKGTESRQLSLTEALLYTCILI